MSLTITFGNAFEVPAGDSIGENPAVRVYRVGTRLFVGYDTSENVHACDSACVESVMSETGNQWEPVANDVAFYAEGSAFVDTNAIPGSDPLDFATADVGSFDPGDDSYVLCGACNAELLRDDERFEAEYGHPITRTCRAHGLEDCSSPECVRARGGSVMASEQAQQELWGGTE